MTAKDQGRIPDIEQRLPVIVTTLSVILLLAFMPSRIRMFPQWVFYAWSAMALFPMIAVGIATNKDLWLKIEHIVVLLFCILCEISICVALRGLFNSIVYRPAEVSGIQLLASSVAVWVTNVLAFTLAYWQIDRNGPLGLAQHAAGKPDWHFPSQDFPVEAGSGWRPVFVDYLFLGFSTSTAFSMTEAVPLTPRAKVLMMIQSLVSLVTIVIVGARAINILGT